MQYQSYEFQSYSQEYESPAYNRPSFQSKSEYYHNEENEYSRRLPQGQLVKLCCKGNTDYTLAARDGNVVLVPFNPNDPTQQWVKDESWSNRVKDNVGHPAFCLVNKATGQALRHALSEHEEVMLVPYEDGSYDGAVMWSQSEDMAEGFTTIRMANNINLNLDAFQADRKHGGVKDGNRVVLWKWNKQPNQLWKIQPFY